MPNLFPIELLGRWSSEVESLPSYLARSAYHHGVSIGKILQHARKMNGTKYESKAYFKPQEIIQYSYTTNNIVRGLKYCTGFDFEQSTLIFMQSVLGRSSKEIIKGFRWCPECFLDMESMGIEPYIKLKWHLSSIKYCPLHFTEFNSQCEHCGCDQATYKRNYSLNKCQKCEKSLSNRKVLLGAKDVHASWEENAFDILKLFSDLAEKQFEGFEMDGIQKSVNDLSNWYAKNGNLGDFNDHLGWKEVPLFLRKGLPISLMTARRIAYKLGVSLFSLMSGKAIEETRVIDSHVFGQVPLNYLEPRKKEDRDHELILKKMKASLDSFESPPTLISLAKSVNVSVGYIRYRYPALCRKLVRDSRDKQLRERLRKIYLAQKMALSYFIDEKYSDHPKSKHQAYKEVKIETGLAKGAIEEAIHRAYNALYNGEV